MNPFGQNIFLFLYYRSYILKANPALCDIQSGFSSFLTGDGFCILALAFHPLIAFSQRSSICPYPLPPIWTFSSYLFQTFWNIRGSTRLYAKLLKHLISIFTSHKISILLDIPQGLQRLRVRYINIKRHPLIEDYHFVKDIDWKLE